MRIHYLLLVHAFMVLCHSASAKNDIEPGKEFYTAVRAEDPIVVDGDLSEWPDSNVVVNPQFYLQKGSGSDPNLEGELVHFETWNGGAWTGLDDHAFETQVVYNDENVYLGIIVTDEYHENAAQSAWNGDSVQIMIADDVRESHVALYRYALGGVEDSLGELIVQRELGPSGTEAVVVRNKDKKRTTYEIRLPKESFALDELSSGVQFGLGILSTDGDEFSPGEKGWGGWGPHAIVHGKSPSETALITLGPVPIALNLRPEFDPADESTSVQILGQVVLSDGTLQTLAGSELTWSKIEGPISTIDDDGNAMLMEVTDDARATVVGNYQNVRSSISFTVSDVPSSLSLSDNHTDRDGDGQSDEFEMLAGSRADDASDFFNYHFKKDAEGVFIELSMVIPGTRYIIEASTDTRIYRKIATINPLEIEADLKFRDPQPFDRTKFYRVRLEPIDIAK